jgi:hypothetical protein
VKWVRSESGSARALALLQDHLDGELRLWMLEQCAAELLAVVRRDKGAGAGGHRRCAALLGR